MKHIWNVALGFVLAAAGLLMPLAGGAATVAAEVQPVAVVSVASADELFKDICFLTDAAGAPELGRLVTLMAGPYTAAMDKTRPAGLYVTHRGEREFPMVSFVAVKDLTILLATFEQQIGKPRDAGDGVLEIATNRPQSLFVKGHKGWAFVAQKKEWLADVPDDPAKLLGGMDQRYTVGARLRVSQLPAEIQQMPVNQLRRGFEERLARMSGENSLRRRIVEGVLAGLADVIQMADEVTVGWQVDAEKQMNNIEFSLTALPDTVLAKELALLQMRKSDFAGFLLPDGAMRFHVTLESSPAEIEQVLALGHDLWEQAMEGIAKDKNLVNDEERQRARDIVNQFFAVAESNVKAGKTDMGAVIELKSQEMAVALGGRVAEGAKLEDAVKKLVAFAQQKRPNFPDVKFDAEKYQGVTFHKTSVPMPQARSEARRLLGDPLQVVVGTGEHSAYVAVGRDGEALLKRVLDQNAAQKDQALAPIETTIAFIPILEAAVALDANNPALTKALELLKASGKDQIAIRILPAERGGACRIEMETGLLRVVGEAVRVLTPIIQGRRRA